MAVGAALMLGALHGWLLGKQAGRTESELAADDYQSLVEARDRRIAKLHVKAEDSAARCDLLQQGIAERAESVETLTARVAAQADRIDRANRDAINMRARFDDQLSQRDGRIEQLRELHANAASLASSLGESLRNLEAHSANQQRQLETTAAELADCRRELHGTTNELLSLWSRSEKALVQAAESEDAMRVRDQRIAALEELATRYNARISGLTNALREERDRQRTRIGLRDAEIERYRRAAGRLSPDAVDDPRSIASSYASSSSSASAAAIDTPATTYIPSEPRSSSQASR